MVLTTSSSHHVKKLKRKKPVYFCSDMNNEVLYKNFLKRGWVEVSNVSGMFNFYWANMLSFRRVILSPSYHLRNDQIVNHFPNSYEFSRKDLLLKHFKNYRKRLERRGDPIAEKLPIDAKLDVGGTRYKYLNFIPQTFILPMEYNMFVEEFNKPPQCTWIIKPSGKSQGIGIFLVNKLVQLKKWAYESRNFYQMPQISRDYYVISKYIENPLLIDQKKFDIRLYVLVTSFNPIKAFLYNEGFCRFCSEKYDKSLTNLTNRYAHLTNVSIQKNNVDVYNQQDGGKCSLDNLWDHLDRTFGETTKDICIDNIINLIRHTLRAVAPVISSDRHCFELYGFDIIIDGRAKPWLIEVNSSPSIVGTTDDDTALKTRLIDNVLKVVLPSSGRPDAKWDKNPSIQASANFIVLINEGASLNYAVNQESHKVNKIQKSALFKTRTHWYSSRSFAGSFRAQLRAILARISNGKTISVGSLSKIQKAPIKGISKTDRKKVISRSNENLLKNKNGSNDKQMFALSKTTSSNLVKVLRKKTYRTCCETIKPKKISICLGKNQSKICKKRLKIIKSPYCTSNICNLGEKKFLNLPVVTSSEVKTKSQNSGKTQKNLLQSEQDNNERKKSVNFTKVNIVQKNQTSYSANKVKTIGFTTHNILNIREKNNNSNKKSSDSKDNNDNKIKDLKGTLNQHHLTKKPTRDLSKKDLSHSRIDTNQDKRKILDPENNLNIPGNVNKTVHKKNNYGNSGHASNNIRKPLGIVGNKKTTQSKSDNRGRKKSSYTRKTVTSSISKKKSSQSRNNKSSRRLSSQNGAAIDNIGHTRKPINSIGNKKFPNSRIDNIARRRKSSDSGVIMNTSGYSGKPVKKKCLDSRNNTNNLPNSTRASRVTFEKRRSSYSSNEIVGKRKSYINRNTIDQSKTSCKKRSSQKIPKKNMSTTKTSRAKQIKQKNNNGKRSTTKLTNKGKKIMSKNQKKRTNEAPFPNVIAGPVSILKSINVVDPAKRQKQRKKKTQPKPSSSLSSYVFDYAAIHRRTKAFVFQK